MTTALTKPLARQVEYDGHLYKVVVSADGVRLTAKGARRGVMLTWGDVLNFDEVPASVGDGGGLADAPSPRTANARKLGMQDVVAADVLLLMKRANETLAEAATLIDHASELPSLLAKNREPPQSSEKERSDWFIEPLLTIRQVSQLLGVSSRRVRSLPLKAIKLDEQIRYHPADLRQFLASATSNPSHRGPVRFR
jgi:hypothetical protein